MIESVIVAVAAVGALAWVTLPMRIGGPRIAEEESPEAADASARKNTALVALLELEEERDSGKLSTDDYKDLRGQYEREAINALNDADAVSVSESEDDVVEAEIRRIKASLTCPSCGSPRTPGEPCNRCGA